MLTLKETLTLILACANGEAYHRAFDEKYGICSQIVDFSREGNFVPKYSCEDVDHLYEQWSEFSGDVDFPVPSPVPLRDETGALLSRDRAAGRYYIVRPDKWEGPYGESRKRLLQFLIDNV